MRSISSLLVAWEPKAYLYSKGSKRRQRRNGAITTSHLHLEEVLELGNDLFFVARQKRLSIDGDHFYIDLVFYHRELRCFLLIDLKSGRLTQQDVGQMLLYTGYYATEEMREGENPPIGLILCTDKNEAAVRYTLSQSVSKVFTSRYQLHLPSEEQLRAELIRERELIEAHRLLEE